MFKNDKRQKKSKNKIWTKEQVETPKVWQTLIYGISNHFECQWSAESWMGWPDHSQLYVRDHAEVKKRHSSLPRVPLYSPSTVRLRRHLPEVKGQGLASGFGKPSFWT